MACIVALVPERGKDAARSRPGTIIYAPRVGRGVDFASFCFSLKCMTMNLILVAFDGVINQQHNEQQQASVLLATVVGSRFGSGQYAKRIGRQTVSSSEKKAMAAAILMMAAFVDH